MKRAFHLFSISAAGFVCLLFAYSNSKNSLESQRQLILSTLAQIEQSDALLDRNILRSHASLAWNYDALVTNVEYLNLTCDQLKNSKLMLYAHRSTKIDSAIDEYCNAISQKISNVEKFKSTNAIIQSSLYYLHDPSMQTSVKNPLKLSKQDVLNQKKILDDLLIAILNSEAESKLSQVFHVYNNENQSAANISLTYSRILFFSCAILLVFSIYYVLSLWKSAKQLLLSNENLEQRVVERTEELSASQKQITRQQAILSASSKMSALGEMAGSIAHEINTPLAVISMRIEQLEENIAEGLIETASFLDSLSIIKKTTIRISKIINGLRHFSGQGQLAPNEKVTILSLIEDTLSFCNQKFKNHGVEIEVQCLPEIADSKINCRTVEISQVLLNLLNNSFDAIQPLEDKWIRIEVGMYGPLIEISVVDSGPGIPLEIRDKLMQPFFTTKDVGSGTGLGLSISRGIAESHNGKLFVDEQCKNTKFKLSLPKAG